MALSEQVNWWCSEGSVLEIRILGMAQFLVIVNSRERCNWDIRTAYWRREKSRRSEASESFYIDVEAKGVHSPAQRRVTRKTVLLATHQL